jgi:predicted flap endonuclease-1-like 5' DNA nuclease
MNYNFLIIACDIAPWQLLLALLLPFLLGYILRRFLESNTRSTLLGLQSENDSMKKEVAAAASYKSSFQSSDAELKKLKAAFASLEGDHGKAKTDLDAALKRLRPFEGVDVGALRTRIAELETHNLKMKNEFDQMMGASASQDAANADAAADVVSLREKFAGMEEENDRLRRELKAAVDAKNAVVRSEDNVGKLREDVRELSGKVGGLTVENERLKAAAADAKAAAGSNDSAIADLTAKLSAAEAAANAAGGKAVLLEKEGADLKNRLSAAEAAKAAAEAGAAEAAGLKTKLGAADIDLSAARLRITELEAARDKAAAAAGALQAAQSEAGDLKKQLSGAQAETDGLKKQLADAQSANGGLKAELDACKAAHEKAVAEAAVVMVAPAPAPADDLKVVEGIGPKVDALLQENGITTWRQLSNTSSDALRAILKKGGDRFAILNPNSWPKQAALLADGKMDEFRAYTDYLIAGVDPAEHAQAKAAAAPEKIDDLKIVEGIGPKIEELCHGIGIYTFEKLANTPVEQLQDMLHAAGPRYQMHDPGTWPGQARLAADGKMDELKTWQDQLKHGKA